ncbi:ATP-binding protein (plasmid) [Aneurinibacillus sp. Ricciae_BoGa-3]|uniref:ATP-binding protein n=1 Tax=Aneurinibacillus sp. Ricciae_BoGa-3 TaxID=3022697 RepID=UPI002340FF2C|nr:ATP-binding protein [Aneurinibacillus sp. Ricciae_BoGa-3]WCK57085.1 ATP-binding protein [Aneurinibacillus sp. Ricciae_BoGa-3]
MKLRFLPNDRKPEDGTEIFVQCSQEELDESKRLFLSLTELDKVDQNVYLPAGDIYILGLKTTRLPNTLFSYNIEDKRLTNRDRNIVETAKLQENIVKILREAKNQKLIREYLASFKTNPTAYEYQLSFLPDKSKIENWKKVLSKLYPKAVVSSDMKSDLYTTAMGYTVLRNIPYNVLQVLKYLGLQDSSVYARDYKGEALLDKNKLIFPVSEDYVGNWTRKEAIREFIANSLDAGDKVRITHNGTETRISDNGTGIMKKHFIFGVSQKGDGAIGQFGEGMKVAFLVLARSGSPVKIESVGYTYEAKLEYNEEFGVKLLVIYFEKNKRSKGTSIVFKSTQEELEEAKGMFAQFQGSRRKSIQLPEMEVFLDKPGVVYSNGLETAKIEAIFSYNVKDKGIVITRDRNAVDTYKLNALIEQFLAKTSDESVIETFLTKWQEKTGFAEYQAQFYPTNDAVWKKIVKKVFPKACFAVDGWDNEDFIAKQAGYTLLRNVPYSVQKVLERNGIERADKIARKYKDKGILLGDRLVYPITKEYGNQWTVIDAIKELIANSLDTHTRCSISYKDGVISISDKGDGLSRQNLLFGNSTKTDDQIGMFGEGLKMASLILARNNRSFKVVTKGFEYTATIERDTQYHADVLVIHLSKSKKRVGTDITFIGAEKELNQAKNFFLEFNKNFKDMSGGIYTPGGNLFVNGVFVQHIDSLFSYNLLSAKELMSRDRKSVNIEKAKSMMATMLSMTQNKKVIETFITDRQFEKMEHQLSLYLTAPSKATWKQVVDKVYPKSCFATGTDYDGVARDKGYELILSLSQTLVSVLSSLGIQSADKVVTLKGDENAIKKRFDPKKLSVKGKKRWEKAKELFSKLYGVRLSNRIELVAEFKSDVVTDSTWGLYNWTTDLVYVLAELVDDVEAHPFDELMGVLIHEQVHRQSGAYDRTREFEFALSMELGRIAGLFFKFAK